MNVPINLEITPDIADRIVVDALKHDLKIAEHNKDGQIIEAIRLILEYYGEQ